MNNLICSSRWLLTIALVAGSLHATAIGWIDSINRETYNQGDEMTGGGWAADDIFGAPVRQVDIQIDGQTVAYGSLGLDRPDVEAAVGRTDFRPSGYVFSWNIGTLTPGTHTLTVWAWTQPGPAQLSGSKTFTVMGTNPAPTVILSSSSSTVGKGQSVNFTVNASSSSGLNELGLELCDAGGVPIKNLGLAGSSGSNSSKVFSWSTNIAGSYNFDGYAWNADRTLLVRTNVITVTVSAITGYIETVPVFSSAKTASALVINYSINDNGFVSGTHYGTPASQWDLVTYKTAPGYIVWVLKWTLPSTTGAVGSWKYIVVAARYIRDTRSWELTEVNWFNGGPAANTYQNGDWKVSIDNVASDHFDYSAIHYGALGNYIGVQYYTSPIPKQSL